MNRDQQIFQLVTVLAMGGLLTLVYGDGCEITMFI